MIEVRIKGLKEDDVKLEFESTSLSVTAKLPVTYRTEEGGNEYR